jgi:hypothetical protein
VAFNRFLSYTQIAHQTRNDGFFKESTVVLNLIQDLVAFNRFLSYTQIAGRARNDELLVCRPELDSGPCGIQPFAFLRTDCGSSPQ